MQNYFMRCPSCKKILLYLILMIALGDLSVEDNQGTEKLYIAKRNFRSRERDYLKTKPLSNDLRSFIKRIKRRTPEGSGKSKRDDEAREHMFVVNNGNIVPLENMSEVTADVPSSDPSGLGNFTVIPLVIPITVKTFTNATFCNVSEYSDEALSTESIRKSEEIFDKETMQTEKSANVEKEKPTDDIAETENSIKQERTGKWNTPPPSTVCLTEEVTRGVSTAATEFIVDDSSDSKSDNMKFLNKVLTDVQDLISYEQEGKHSGNNEGAMCSVIGDWDSKAGGMQLQITGNNESAHSPAVQVVALEPPAQSGFLLAENWTVTARMPFNHSSLIVLTAISNKTVASFIGDCRICGGSETISGNWMLARRSQNCKDRQDAYSFFGDVISKDNVRRLQKKHLDSMSTMNAATTES